MKEVWEVKSIGKQSRGLKRSCRKKRIPGGGQRKCIIFSIVLYNCDYNRFYALMFISNVNALLIRYTRENCKNYYNILRQKKNLKILIKNTQIVKKGL